jgi:transposase
MLGYKPRNFKTHTAVSIEDLVPKDNFYRHVEAVLDLSFVRDLVRDCYSPSMGRPSIDPVVFFKLQLIMFFEGIRSERQMLEMASLNLAHRWFLGYDLDENVPDHSSMTKIRKRYGLETFQRFFEHIVELCIEAGLVWGQELFFDATKVEANADIDGMVPRFCFEAKHHLQELFGEEELADGRAGAQPERDLAGEIAITPRCLVGKYDGTRITARPERWYKRWTDAWVSPTDPDATPMKRYDGERASLGYQTQYVVDGGRARIILAALVTPASVLDGTPMLDLARWVRFRWHLKPKIAVGDSKYGTAPNIAGLEQDGIKAYMPRPDHSKRGKFYPRKRFHYDAARDLYICPQGQELPLRYPDRTKQVFKYQADAEVCRVCPARTKCTTAKSGRSVSHSFFKAYLDRAGAYRDTEAYHKAMRKRKLWPEPLFGEAKQWHGLDRFRLRGLGKVNTEGLMVAAGQNLKRLLTYRGWGRRRGPAGWGAALVLEPSLSFCLLPSSPC